MKRSATYNSNILLRALTHSFMYIINRLSFRKGRDLRHIHALSVFWKYKFILFFQTCGLIKLILKQLLTLSKFGFKMKETFILFCFLFTLASSAKFDYPKVKRYNVFDGYYGTMVGDNSQDNCKRHFF